MITDATTTQDLIATFSSNARPLSEVSFEQGCAILDAIEMFDNRTAAGKLGTWQALSVLPFVPTTDVGDDRPSHLLVWEKLARDVVTWTCRQRNSSALEIGATFTAWVVIDRATHVTWVECSPVQQQRTLHPRDLREAGEFPSSSRGTVSAHAFLRMGDSWHEVLNSVREAYHEAWLLLDEETAAHADLHVTDGAVGIRVSQLAKPARIRTLTVSGEGSLGIDLDDGDDGDDK